jgi:ligand-binding SRPBCC domain-containing protein
MIPVWQTEGTPSAPALVKHAHGLRAAPLTFCTLLILGYPRVMPQLRSEQFIPGDPAKVWDYFATPYNLNELTPPDLRFEILSELPEHMYAGQMIEYRISPLPGIWMRWLTEISHLQPGVRFVDEQRAGPYKLWHHEHHFAVVPRGVLMTDLVTYTVGWGPVGWFAEKIWVRGELERIFAYRRLRVSALFGGV